MTMFQYVSENMERIKKEIRMGIIPSSILKHWQIYGRYDYYIRAGNTAMLAIHGASRDCSVSERHTFRVIKKMQDEI
jgi:hypothetical protein